VKSYPPGPKAPGPGDIFVSGLLGVLLTGLGSFAIATGLGMMSCASPDAAASAADGPSAAGLQTDDVLVVVDVPRKEPPLPEETPLAPSPLPGPESDTFEELLDESEIEDALRPPGLDDGPRLLDRPVITLRADDDHARRASQPPTVSSPAPPRPEKMPPRTSWASGGGRLRACGKFGGSRASESAVNAALRWLARHQEPDGRWDARKHGGRRVDPGVTGIAVLAFLGAGHTDRAGACRRNVEPAVRWLMDIQDEDGLIGGGYSEGRGYNHAIGGLALAEAYGMARNPMVGRSAQKAIDYSINTAQKEYSGWRYRPGQDADLSVTAWYCQQLKSAKLGGLKVYGRGFAGTYRFLDEVTVRRGGAVGQCRYRPREEPTTTMTAAGALCRLWMGARPWDELVAGAAGHLREHLPRWESDGDVNFYYWYFGGLAMFQVGGAHWKAWNVAMRDMLVRWQRRGGDADGSWNPVGPWCRTGGRVYSTAMGCLCLEVYYRYLPMAR